MKRLDHTISNRDGGRAGPQPSLPTDRGRGKPPEGIQASEAETLSQRTGFGSQRTFSLPKRSIEILPMPSNEYLRILDGIPDAVPDPEFLRESSIQFISHHFPEQELPETSNSRIMLLDRNP